MKKQSSLPRVNSLSESQEIPEAANSVKSDKTEEEEEDHESQHRSPFADFVFMKPNPTSELCINVIIPLLLYIYFLFKKIM